MYMITNIYFITVRYPCSFHRKPFILLLQNANAVHHNADELLKN